jgi:hypothetical protein
MAIRDNQGRVWFVPKCVEFVMCASFTHSHIITQICRDIRFASTADRDAWIVKLQAAARGEFLYDAHSVNVAADVLTTTEHAPQLDARTGVDFRILPAGMAPISTNSSSSSSTTAATTPVAHKSSSHLTYPDSDDEEIAQRHAFGGRYTEWVGPDVYDHGINIPSGVVTPLSNSIAPSLLDSSTSNLLPSQEIELDSGPASPSDFPVEQPQPIQFDAPAMPNVPSFEPTMPPPAYTDIAPPTMFATQPQPQQPQPQFAQQFAPQAGPYQAPNYNNVAVQFPSVPTYQPGAAPRQQQWQSYPGTFAQ